MKPLQSSVIPWVNGDELIQVYDCIYNNNNDVELLIYARNRMSIWLSRVSHVHHVNATHAILNAIIEDRKYANDNPDDRDASVIHSLYAIAVIRFCNTLSHTQFIENQNKSHTKSLKKLAKELLCPLWIVECRHSLCHGTQNQESLQQLRDASHFGLNWMRVQFWDVMIKNNDDTNFYQLLYEYYNDIPQERELRVEMRKKLKFEINSNIKRHQRLFVSSFVNYLMNEHKSEYKLKPESFELPKLLFRKFMPFFRIINRHKCFFHTLHSFVSRFDSDDRNIRQLSSCWVYTVVKGTVLSEQLNRQLRTVICNQLNWLRLLYHVLKYPNEFTSNLAKQIIPFVGDLINETQVKQITHLTDIYSDAANDDDDDDDNDKDKDSDDDSSKPNNFQLKTFNEFLGAIKSDTDDCQSIENGIEWWNLKIGASVPIDRENQDLDTSGGEGFV